ncbi:flagellar protein [Sulfitobacter mediterraneus]|uniref:flagellin N-terminal helical domain-containing protein n=1 Tax=Sulfitobacter mediterraneus TaxID=83219 RepID=UPI001931C9EF|nr:flagellin [Sulfitobacter mediterraneus]MBM1631597.1 flagellar protein [Sulfitobacter mediterraneus]MBM1639412.1 flagellar protein [Sulfitobacter mediterraneus]MBM1643461.1 flagellar protein [Sulfitobacter mediterraneus]MBM1647507.1 flagellar protein [Sulfitobacter mediterraneus]MBM1651552.1 flagellar protein [Sulfitobacter mediterraneus]
MSSILNNNSATVALATLKNVNRGLNETQSRISTGLQVRSGKENAAYFAISETMKGDSGMFKAINEGMTATKNSVATARLGAETVKDLANQMVERIAFAQSDGVDKADVQSELDALAENMQSAIDQATFNGDDLVGAASSTVTVVSGISRASGSFATTTISFDTVDLQAIQTAMAAVDVTDTSTTMAAKLVVAEGQLSNAIDAATSMGVTEKTLEGQMDFLDSLTDTLDSGISSMVDANMEEEAARLQAYQVQQQLATQSLSIANQAPGNILSLFR